MVSVVKDEHGVWNNCIQLGTCHANSFSVNKLLTNGLVEKQYQNYWLAPDNKPAEFVLDLGCNKIVNMMELVNTHNAYHRDRSAKEFKVFTSSFKDGPWQMVVHKTLQDSRAHADPLPVLSFPFSTYSEATARFVKFNLISWYGYGGGLQYFAVKGIKSH